MCELWNRNSPSAVLEWMYRALDKSDITPDERKSLEKAGVDCVAGGGWRGDVCDKWRSMGYDGSKIEDWYP